MRLSSSLLSCLAILILANGTSQAESRLKMSTTTSTQDSGLLKSLLPPFEKANNCRVDVIAVGTGQALKLGEAGDVDVVFVHARKLEDKFIADGYGVNRKDVMYNDFVVIGPKNDPAGIRSAKSAAEAFTMIAARHAQFVSRGDRSGTHTKEREIWKESGVDPKGAWYLEAGQGMGPVITMATERRAYTLSDRGTYNAFKGGKSDLVILFQGERGLFNPYGIMAVNPKRFPHVNHTLAMKLVEFVSGADGQRIISVYKAHGEPVFFTYRK